MYVEMSRVETHGGGAWAFPNCLWAPTRKQSGAKWPFWENVHAVKDGDTVLHLRGVHPNAHFVGYSRAGGDGILTSQRPPNPGAWSFAEKFFRADLVEFTPFFQPINLASLFAERRTELKAYFDKNKKRLSEKARIFYVFQSGRLQCLNGAYLSEVDGELLSALFGDVAVHDHVQEERALVSVATGQQLRIVQSRLGQAEFSRGVKMLYEHKCCFPECDVNDPRFLIGSHIARWSDNERLRGQLGNGLCLCVFHDKAFELGLFTLDEHLNVYLNPREALRDSRVMSRLLHAAGQPIRKVGLPPLYEALYEHWNRIDVRPIPG